jgi:hypothetical protein
MFTQLRHYTVEWDPTVLRYDNTEPSIEAHGFR